MAKLLVVAAALCGAAAFAPPRAGVALVRMRAAAIAETSTAEEPAATKPMEREACVSAGTHTHETCTNSQFLSRARCRSARDVLGSRARARAKTRRGCEKKRPAARDVCEIVGRRWPR